MGERPAYRNRRVRLEPEERGQVTPYAGLALAYKLSQGLDLPRAIDRELTLLKLHLPYHESDHVLTHTFNIFAGGECIEDGSMLQNSGAFQNLVGSPRIPDPTTAGDFLRRFRSHDLDVLEQVIDEVRSRVWKLLPRAKRRRATVDLDSSLKPVYGECKQGAAFSYKKTWSYHPLLISVAETNECLRLRNRPGNVGSADGVEEALEPCLGRLGEQFDRVVVRGDSAFYRRELMRTCLAHGADFALVMRTSPALEHAVQALPEGAFRPFDSRSDPAARPRRGKACRRRRPRLRRLKARRRGYRILSTVAEWVAEMRHRPRGLDRDFRVVVKRQLVREENQGELFERYVYRFVITTLEDLRAADLLKYAYGRCNQENTIEQLKNGVSALRMPTGELVANGAFMMAALLAWNLRAWLSLLVLPAESLRWEWKRFRHAFVYAAAKIVRAARVAVVRLAASHRFTLQMIEASRKLDALVFR
jgi:hypothetical protein